MDLGMDTIFTPNAPISNFYELGNGIIVDTLLSKRDFVLIGMPELMLRMKIGSMYSLE